MTQPDNGATILERKPSTRHLGAEVVLCRWEPHTYCFVTWIMGPKGDCHWGRYHRDLETAAREWEERS